MRRNGALDLIHGVNAAARPLDRALFAPRAADDRDPLFIVGAPRSGTTLLFQALAHSLRVTYLPRLLNYAYGASHLMLRVFARPLRRHRPIFVSRFGATPGLLSPSESFAFWRRWFWKGHDGDHDHPEPLPDAKAADLRDAVHAIEAHRHAPLLVKCPYLVLAVPALAAALPRARFIFLVRDPLDVGLSILRGRAQSARSGWWSVRPSGYLDHAAESEADQVMWQIAETTTRVRDALESLPADRWRKVDYEAFCAHPRETLRELRDWLAPAGFEAWPDDEIPDRFATGGSRGARDTGLIERLAASPWYERAKAAIR